MSALPIVHFRDLGRMGYREAWAYQEFLLQQNVQAKARAAGYATDSAGSLETQHYLLFVEHPPVYTLGKSGKESHLLVGEERLKQMGIDWVKTNRGGDITFHGPQQVVGYPILDLEKIYTDIGRYLRSLEEVIILTLEEYGLQGQRSPGETGVWLDPDMPGRERKICAMGIRCSRWVTMHGFAFNVNTNLEYFRQIVPCGIEHKQVTSLEKELGVPVPVEEVKEKIRKNFSQVFGVNLVVDTKLPYPPASILANEAVGVKN